MSNNIGTKTCNVIIAFQFIELRFNYNRVELITNTYLINK